MLYLVMDVSGEYANFVMYTAGGYPNHVICSRCMLTFLCMEQVGMSTLLCREQVSMLFLLCSNRSEY